MRFFIFLKKVKKTSKKGLTLYTILCIIKVQSKKGSNKQ
nr:MAG TPA: hypothetical protein [Caudoviricetes sp.]